MARCEGHQSWVSGVAFDAWFADRGAGDHDAEPSYRLVSVGQDTLLIAWDFSVTTLARPKVVGFAWR